MSEVGNSPLRRIEYLSCGTDTVATHGVTIVAAVPGQLNHRCEAKRHAAWTLMNQALGNST